MGFGNTGGLFLGVLKEPDRQFLLKLLKKARENGYTRFLEPGAGALALSYIAAEAGFEPQNIEASDVSYFSRAFARGVNKQTTEDMEIVAEGFDSQELLDPATALYAQMYLKMAKNAGQDYFYELFRDLKYRKKEHIERIQDQIDKVSAKLNGIHYSDKDMIEHILEVADDPHAVIVAYPPTYTSCYEKFFDTGGKLQWREPPYEIYDAENGMRNLYEILNNCKALAIIFEECAAGESVGAPVYAREAGRVGMHTYATTNRPEEVIKLIGGSAISRGNASKMEPVKYDVIPKDYEITEDSNIAIVQVKPENIRYYRSLWTHNFVGGSGASGYALIVDGYIAGVFGYQTLGISLSGTSDIEISFNIGPTSNYRLNRLMYMLAMREERVKSFLSDLDAETVNGVQTTIITKYPNSSTMRGLFKKYGQDKGVLGYKLKYRADLKTETDEEILKEWIRKEKSLKWKREQKALQKK